MPHKGDTIKMFKIDFDMILYDTTLQLYFYNIPFLIHTTPV